MCDTVSLQCLMCRGFILFLSHTLLSVCVHECFMCVCVHVRTSLHWLPRKHSPFLQQLHFPLGNYQHLTVSGLGEKVIPDNGHALGKGKGPDPPSQLPSTTRGELVAKLSLLEAPSEDLRSNGWRLAALVAGPSGCPAVRAGLGFLLLELNSDLGSCSVLRPVTLASHLFYGPWDVLKTPPLLLVCFCCL